MHLRRDEVNKKRTIPIYYQQSTSSVHSSRFYPDPKEQKNEQGRALVENRKTCVLLDFTPPPSTAMGTNCNRPP